MGKGLLVLGEKELTTFPPSGPGTKSDTCVPLAVTPVKASWVDSELEEL
jgi:hypothetical protein